LKITNDDAAIIKGMLARGDKQQWIAAWFGGTWNSGRMSEINTGMKSGAKFAHVKPASRDKLPPIGPYVSGRSAHQALLALGPVRATIERMGVAQTSVSEAIERAVKALTAINDNETMKKPTVGRKNYD
jgi:hypothetical protein